MTERASLFDLFRRSLNRDGKIDEFPATDPGDAAFDLAMANFADVLPEELSVVGNASGLLATRFGVQIDARPTLRFNSARIENPDAQGARWDFLATSDRETLRHYSEHPPLFHTLIFTPCYDRYMDHLDAKRFDTPHLVYPMRLSIELMQKLRARPSTGAQILWLLHCLGGRQVHIFGFDPRRRPAFLARGRGKDTHDHFGEMMLFRRLIRRNGWVLHR